MTGIELALLNGAEHAGEHGMGLGTAFGSIAATDLPGDHRCTERVFGAPVGRVDRIGFEQKSEDGRKFDGEMGRESLSDTPATGAINEGIQLVLQIPTRNPDAVRGDAALLVAVADVQAVLQNPLNAPREVALAMITDQDAAAAQQMAYCPSAQPTRRLSRVDSRDDRRRGAAVPPDGLGGLVERSAAGGGGVSGRRKPNSPRAIARTTPAADR